MGVCNRVHLRASAGYTPHMPPPRQPRLRVLEALEDRVKQFRTREELYPLRVPRDPILLDDVILQALPDMAFEFDPQTLRSRTLLTLEWEDASWDAWVVTLPSRLKLYCDSDTDETRILASGGRNAGDESDRLFLGLLAESAGEAFGIEMSGGAPVRVRSSIADRPFLVDMFVNLFEVTNTESSVRRALAADDAARVTPIEIERREAGGRDFRVDVERWLAGRLR
jgi:hypothetical protein